MAAPKCGPILGVGMIYKALMGLCEGTLHFQVLGKKYVRKNNGIIECFRPAVAQYAVLYGREEQKRTRNSKVSAKGVFRAYRRSRDIELGLIDHTEPINPITIEGVDGTGDYVRYPYLPPVLDGAKEKNSLDNQ